eukprot:Partr_v1_DN26784_c3_g1_i2_m8512 putative Smu-1 suppressor of mec-8 and unc-52 homolog (C. elegans)
MIEVKEKDLLLLIAQYLRDAGLTKTLSELEHEAGITYCPVSHQLSSQIMAGEWTSVCEQVAEIENAELLYDLYEHIIVDLHQQERSDVAEELMTKSRVLLDLRETNEQRYLELAKRRKDHKCRVSRQTVATELCEKLKVVPNGRLLQLVRRGLLAEIGTEHSGRWDLYRSLALPSFRLPQRITASLDSLAVNACCGSPDAQFWIAGLNDGRVVTGDSATGLLLRDRDILLKSAVYAVAVSPNGQMLAVGTATGDVNLFDIQSVPAKRIRSYRIHSESISYLQFHHGDQILSGGQDSMIKLYGMNSGRQLKEFRGHSSFINGFFVYRDRLYSCASDHAIKLWDMKTGACLQTVSFNGPVVAMQVMNERYFVAATRDQLVLLSYQLMTILSHDLKSDIAQLSASKDSKYLNVVTVGGSLMSFSFKLSNPEDERVILKQELPIFEDSKTACEVSGMFQLANDVIVIHTRKGQVKLVQ